MIINPFSLPSKLGTAGQCYRRTVIYNRRLSLMLLNRNKNSPHATCKSVWAQPGACQRTYSREARENCVGWSGHGTGASVSLPIAVTSALK